jgi:hypothetical protein
MFILRPVGDFSPHVGTPETGSLGPDPEPPHVPVTQRAASPRVSRAAAGSRHRGARDRERPAQRRPGVGGRDLDPSPDQSGALAHAEQPEA